MSQSATPATQNDVTTCLETFEKEKFCSFPHRHGEATGKPETRDETRGCRKNEHFVRDFLQVWHFRRVSKQVGMSQSATPATQNDMTTCLETFEKGRFCSFPHRHGDATGKPETRDKTRRNIKTSISCETSSNVHSLKHAERTCFAASPIDTATPLENQRLEKETGGSTKTSISCEISSDFHTLQLQTRRFPTSFP